MSAPLRAAEPGADSGSIPFAKLQGAGNGYVVVDGRAGGFDWPRLAPRLTAPHFGIGSDGVAVVESARDPRAVVRMRIFNSDGSEAEMSGNGIRLFARFVIDRGLAPLRDGVLHVETGGGLRSVYPRFEGRQMVGARVAMDEPRFELASLPADSAWAAGADRLLDHEIEVAGRRVLLTGLSLGNPHAVIFVDDAPERFPLGQVAPALQAHPLFPQRVNVEVVRVVARDRLEARVFERGEGETLASGTGATACAVAARLHGWTDEAVEVALPGGVLRVAWAGPGAVAWLDGPATLVFEGVYRDAAGSGGAS